MNLRCAAVIVAGGSGVRAGGSIPKQFQRLGKLPLFLWSVRAFLDSPVVDQVLLVVHRDYGDLARELLGRHGLQDRVQVVPGGARRQDSVLAGVEAVPEEIGIVAVHDAARPFPPSNLEDAVNACREAAGTIFAAPITDSIKRVEGGRISASVARDGLWGAQTPQLAHRVLLLQALRTCADRAIEVTDEASALEAMGEQVAVVESSRSNLKVTLPEDWLMAEAILRARSAAGIDTDIRPGR